MPEDGSPAGTRRHPRPAQDAGAEPPGAGPSGGEPPGAGDRPDGPPSTEPAHERPVDPGDEADDQEALPFGRPGHPLRRTTPFFIGFTGALGVLLAIGLTRALVSSRQVLVLIVVSMFLAVGLNPAVEALQRRGMPRVLAVATVFLGLLAFFVAFGFAIAPPLTDQTTSFVSHAPRYLDQLQGNGTIRRLDEQFNLIAKARDFVESKTLATQAFGGIVGLGKVVLSAAFSAFTVLILTLYFLSSLPSIKHACYELIPRSRRERVQLLADEILERVGGYVSGAIVVATCAGLSTFVFLEVVGVRDYALPLALLVALFDLIPLIGATIGAIAVTLVGFLDSVTVGIACFVFYVVYQQVENYVIYPRVMRHSVDVPPALTIVAALLGGTLLGVVGALLAIPTAAALLLIVREVIVPRQERS